MRATVRLAWTALGACGALCAGGCLERRIYIESEPPGALVYLNDVEVGRTPCDVDFEFYGTYDVRLVREGYEPLLTSAEAKAPLHEAPVIDLVALVLPFKFTNDVRWNFTLTPAADDPDTLIERGRELRGQLTTSEQPTNAEGEGDPR